MVGLRNEKAETKQKYIRIKSSLLTKYALTLIKQKDAWKCKTELSSCKSLTLRRNSTEENAKLKTYKDRTQQIYAKSNPLPSSSKGRVWY